MSELATAVFAANTDAHLIDAPRSRRFDLFRRGFDEAAFLRSLAERGLRWVARSDPRFPARLCTIHDPPAGLFVRGEASLSLLDGPAVAIVGARACSAYGSEVAAQLARTLTQAGAVVISGLARGIDAQAHRGALEAGPTVAVLGCGIDRDYPRAHATLAAEIAATGLIVSEYAPGVEPAPWRFPARNRIVAGLADATVVVEARERSGALITADLALDEGREVLAVPGEITSQLSKGTNHLLRLGAVPVTCVGDVLAVLGLDPDFELHGGSSAALDPRLERVRVAVADGPVGADELARRVGLSAGDVAAALAELELLGVVVQADGVFRETMRRG
ncbi:MAG TPA: DNA-processing protein DprA [Gaiellaceae bacterium]